MTSFVLLTGQPLFKKISILGINKIELYLLIKHHIRRVFVHANLDSLLNICRESMFFEIL